VLLHPCAVIGTACCQCLRIFPGECASVDAHPLTMPSVLLAGMLTEVDLNYCFAIPTSVYHPCDSVWTCDSVAMQTPWVCISVGHQMALSVCDQDTVGSCTQGRTCWSSLCPGVCNVTPLELHAVLDRMLSFGSSTRMQLHLFDAYTSARHVRPRAVQHHGSHCRTCPACRDLSTRERCCLRKG
jgi:hypothetical protein